MCAAIDFNENDDFNYTKLRELIYLLIYEDYRIKIFNILIKMYHIETALINTHDNVFMYVYKNKILQIVTFDSIYLTYDNILSPSEFVRQ